MPSSELTTRNGGLLARMCSNYLDKMCLNAFKATDLDESGTIDAKEAYTAVLLFYLRVGKSVPGATPPAKEVITKLVEIHAASDPQDPDQTTLNYKEFRAMTRMLSEEIALRLSIQGCLVFVASPLFVAGFTRILDVWTARSHLKAHVMHRVIHGMRTKITNVPVALRSSIISSCFLAFVVPRLMSLIDTFVLDESSHLVQKRSLAHK